MLDLVKAYLRQGLYLLFVCLMMLHIEHLSKFLDKQYRRYLEGKKWGNQTVFVDLPQIIVTFIFSQIVVFFLIYLSQHLSWFNEFLETMDHIGIKTRGDAIALLFISRGSNLLSSLEKTFTRLFEKTQDQIEKTTKDAKDKAKIARGNLTFR
mgnify:CR=1 FL=1